TAKVYLDLAISAYAAGDLDAAKSAFQSAVQIDPKIQISPAYKSPELQKMLDEAKAGGSGGDEVPVAAAAVDCLTVKGLQHGIIDTAPAGGALAIEAHVGSDITPVKVSVMYRIEGATDFTESKLSKQGECTYTGTIPAAAMKGALIHYYVAAFNENNKPISAKGSSGSPNILEISGTAAPLKSDNEDPINSTQVDTTPSDNSINGGVIAGGKPPKVMIIVGGGTGFGYVNGNTEGGNMVETCCVGNSLVVLNVELDYMLNRQLAIGVAGRLGIPVGANVNAEGAETHSTIAPAGLLRVRYALSATGEGLRLMGQVGFGVMRNTIKLDTGMAGMDTDIVAQGPILVGAGIGFMKKLGGNFAFVADLSALAGIAIGDKIGTTRVNTGVGADLSLGLAVGF
ncbi:MAG: tetratricopeptide repeat protein, partial [Deltaproteobacteria bacterium]|nr:tetratricopeptide repeat protein [Deltaproteobacteria bacterium]